MIRLFLLDALRTIPSPPQFAPALERVAMPKPIAVDPAYLLRDNQFWYSDCAFAAAIDNAERISVRVAGLGERVLAHSAIAIDGRVTKSFKLPSLQDRQWWKAHNGERVLIELLATDDGVHGATKVKASRPSDTASANSKNNRSANRERPQMSPPMARIRVEADKESNPPKFPLYGVDFSGAAERNGRNSKLWIASWIGRIVTLDHGGGDPGFGRADLTNRILSSTGLWVIDFPFGISATTLNEIGIGTWTEYLNWVAAGRDATERRDTAQLAMQRADLPWHQLRAVDVAHATTWAPLFEQLYRQTLNGARDVLGPLQASGRGRCRVLPFHESGDPASVPHVLEGFPGHTLANRRLPAVGYKQQTQAGLVLRQQIVDALLAAGLPITNADQQRAIADAEGDAVDALVLLLAARRSAHRNAAEWSNARTQGGAEGWFVD